MSTAILVNVICGAHTSLGSWLLRHTIGDMFFWLIVATLAVGTYLVRKNRQRPAGVLESAELLASAIDAPDEQ